MKNFLKLFVLSMIFFLPLVGCKDSDDESYTTEGTPTVTKLVTVSFDSNGESGTMESQMISPGSSLALPECTFSRENYRFLGWSTSKSASTALYKDGETIKPSKDMTLYALWGPRGNFKYRVNHLLQVSYGGTLYEEREYEILAGEAGTKTAAKAKSYKNYTAQTFEQQTILDDDSTVVNIYYNLNS